MRQGVERIRQAFNLRSERGALGLLLFNRGAQRLDLLVKGAHACVKSRVKAVSLRVGGERKMLYLGGFLRGFTVFFGAHGNPSKSKDRARGAN